MMPDGRSQGPLALGALSDAALLCDARGRTGALRRDKPHTRQDAGQLDHDTAEPQFKGNEGKKQNGRISTPSTVSILPFP